MGAFFRDEEGRGAIPFLLKDGERTQDVSPPLNGKVACGAGVVPAAFPGRGVGLNLRSDHGKVIFHAFL